MISAIINCAGSGRRFGSDKMLINFGGEPLFVKTVKTFLKVPQIDEIIVTVKPENLKKFEIIVKKKKLMVKLVKGDKERCLSALNGLRACDGDYVLIHDGARPLVSLDLISSVIDAIKSYPAVMVAVNSLACVKVVKNGFVSKCLTRSQSYLAQTPQAYRKDIILNAYLEAQKFPNYQDMDDSELVDRIGYKVKIIEGDYDNIKITIPSDLILAKKLLKSNSI
jgi:2-C-methyl-D-erythritol 4-phosphate cytidylyltransferase